MGILKHQDLNCFYRNKNFLESEEQQEGYHQAEETHSLRQSKSQDGVGEQLLLERRVPGVADDEGPEDGADTSTRSSDSHGGGSSSNELGSRVNVLLGSGGVDEVGGLHGGGPQAPPGSHAEAGRHGETGNGRHDDWFLLLVLSLVEVNQAILG